MKKLMILTAVVSMVIFSGSAFASHGSSGGGGGGGGGSSSGAKIEQGQYAEDFQFAVQIGIRLPKKINQDQLLNINQDQVVKRVEKGEIEQEQGAGVIQLAGQIIKNARATQLETADIDQDQAVIGRSRYNRGPGANIEQEQEAYIFQGALQIGGRNAKLDQWVDADIYQSEKTPASGRIEQEQEAEITQLAVQIARKGGDYNQDLWAVIDQDQVNKTRGARLEQEQDASITQFAVQIGKNSNMEQRSDAFINQSQVNKAPNRVEQGQRANTTQISIQTGVNAKMGQYQISSTTQTQTVK